MLDSLALTVLGTSSALHHWDDVAETFVLAKRTDEKNVTLVVAGKDGALTERSGGVTLISHQAKDSETITACLTGC